MGAGHAHTLFVHEHSVIHHMAPETKVLAAVMFIFAVAITPREAFWAFAIYFIIVAGLAITSRVKFGFLAARLATIIPFVLFALMLPFIGTGDRVDVAGLALSIDGLWSMWNILAKATIGASVSILLAATTEVPDILKGLSRLKVPPVLTSIASFMIRYLEVIAGELGRMRVAMTARGYDPRWIGQAKPIASSAGALFIRSYERGERVYDAMLARGYTGSMPVLATSESAAKDWVRAMLLPAIGLIISVTAIVVT